MQIQKITLPQLADILEPSAITDTTNHAGMLIHSINHPTIGTATTVQGNDDGALLIKSL